MADSSTANPNLSIIIPARNEQRYIRAALESIATQRCEFARLEAVVVNNGSTDATRSIVEQFRSCHPRLRLRLLDYERPGVAGAKNHGAAAATGSVLLFLDADSRMAPNLAACVLLRSEAGVRAGSIRIVADSSDQIDRAFFELLEFGKVHFHIRAQMFYCERALFAAHGGFKEHLRIAEDQEFLSRLQRAGIRVCHVQESEILTSTRRLHSRPGRLGMVSMLGRWALAHRGIGRQWRYG